MAHADGDTWALPSANVIAEGRPYCKSENVAKRLDRPHLGYSTQGLTRNRLEDPYTKSSKKPFLSLMKGLWSTTLS